MIEAFKTAVKRGVITYLRKRDAARRAVLPGDFNGLPPALWGWEATAAGRLRVEGVDAVDLAERFGTPLHVINSPWLRKTHDDFLKPFHGVQPHVRLATSYKTNPLPAVLAALHELGTYAEVISEFELWLAARLGLGGERIVVNGPGKTRGMIARAVGLGVRVINIDGPGEIDTIATEAQSVGKPQPVERSRHHIDRLVVTVRDPDPSARRSRPSSGFGGKPVAGLIPSGVHLHIGTGLKSVTSYLQAIREVLEFASALASRLGIELTTFDLGGGFGVPTVRGTDDWDDRMVAMGFPAREAFPPDCPSPADYAPKLAALFAALLPNRGTQAEIILEPGRAITSAAQTLLLSCVARKDSAAGRKLILDGGKNITMPLGRTHDDLDVVVAEDRRSSRCPNDRSRRRRKPGGMMMSSPAQHNPLEARQLHQAPARHRSQGGRRGRQAGAYEERWITCNHQALAGDDPRHLGAER